MDNKEQIIKEQKLSIDSWNPTEEQIQRILNEYPTLTRKEAIMALKTGW